MQKAVAQQAEHHARGNLPNLPLVLGGSIFPAIPTDVTPDLFTSVLRVSYLAPFQAAQAGKV